MPLTSQHPNGLDILETLYIDGNGLKFLALALARVLAASAASAYFPDICGRFHFHYSLYVLGIGLATFGGNTMPKESDLLETKCTFTKVEFHSPTSKKREQFF